MDRRPLRIRGATTGLLLAGGLMFGLLLALATASSDVENGLQLRSPVFAQGAGDVPHEFMAQLGGSSHALAFTRDAISDVAWLGHGPRLVAIDLCRPADPRQVGSTPPLAGIVHGVAVDAPDGYETTRGGPPVAGATAWVAAGATGLIAVDVTRPSRPWPVATLPLPGMVADLPGEAQQVVLDVGGETAWVGGPAGVHVVDVRDAREPALVRHIVAPAGGFGDLVRDISLAGEHVWVAWGVEGLVLLRADRGSEERGAFRPQGIVALAVAATEDGRQAYLADGTSIVSLALEADGSIRERGRLALGEWVNGRALELVEAEELLLVATRDRQGKPRGMLVVDVADPAAPRIVATRAPSTLPYAAPPGFGIDLPVDMAAMDERGPVLWAEDDGGLRVIDPRAWLSSPQEPVALEHGRLPLSPPARAIASNAAQAWLAGGDPVLRRVQPFGVFPPASLLGTVVLPEARAPIVALAADVDRVAAVAGEVYVLDGGGRTVQARISGPVAADDVALTGSTRQPLAVVSFGASGLWTIDLSEPDNPLTLGRLVLLDIHGNPVPAEAVAAADGLAVAVDGRSMHVVDLFEPAQPRLLARVETEGGARDVALGNELALIAAEFLGLMVYEVVDPARPELLATLPIPTGARAVAFDALASRAWVAAGAGGVLAIDLRDPAAPRLAATFETPGWAEHVTVIDGVVLVSDGAGGLHVLADSRLTPVPSLPPPAPLAACRSPRLWLPALSPAAEMGG